jgi:NADH dehydrogenase (ubiquinone) 1 alpha subcomplex subunit 13
MTEASLRGGPGLRSVKDMPVLQDGPPPGGFPSVRYGRRIPNTGPTGAAIFGVSALVISYGFYKVRLRRDQRAAVALCALPAEARGARVAQQRAAAPAPARR